MRTGNRRLMREMNSKLVLGLLRSHDSMSQVEISRVSGLCPATITNIVRDLRARALVEEIGTGESIKGRKPTLLRFNPEGRFVIGVEIYVHQLTIAMLDLSGNIKKRVETTNDENKNGFRIRYFGSFTFNFQGFQKSHSLNNFSFTFE